MSLRAVSSSLPSSPWKPWSLGGLVGAGMLLSAACSSSPHRPPPAGDPTTVQPGAGAAGGGGGAPSDGGGATDAGADADAALAECNDLTLNGALVDEQGVTGDPVVGTGGTIADGNYDLSQASVFILGGSGPTGTVYKESIAIAGGTLQRLRQAQSSGGTTTLRATYLLSTSGTNVALTETCPSPAAAETWSFSVNGSQLRLTSLTRRVEFVYTKK